MKRLEASIFFSYQLRDAREPAMVVRAGKVSRVQTGGQGHRGQNEQDPGSEHVAKTGGIDCDSAIHSVIQGTI